MENKSILQDKSFAFAVRIVNLYKYLCKEKQEFVLSKQLLRAGTSIGANIREAQRGESGKDFIHKLGISQKESTETAYWLELLHATDYLLEAEFISMQKDCKEIERLLTKSILTRKKNLGIK